MLFPGNVGVVQEWTYEVLSYIHFFRYNIRHAWANGEMSSFAGNDILVEEALSGIQASLRHAFAGEDECYMEAAWRAVVERK